jgi:hypothetical protein
VRIGPSQRANDGFTLARFTIRATSGSARLPEFFLVGAWPNSMIQSPPKFVVARQCN